MSRLRWIVEQSPRKRLYVKITGGEPFVRPEAIDAIIDFFASHRGAIYKIGIGTNGTHPLGPAFGRVPCPTHVFLSRHAIADHLPTPERLANGTPPVSVDFRLNCNVLRGGVETVSDMERYIVAHVAKDGVSHVCFRELTAVDLDAASIYPREVYSYADYYAKHHVSFGALSDELAAHPRFEQSRLTGNAYDTNRWFWYHHPDGRRVSVKLRSIDEAKLLAYNDTHDGVDEYVIHPDGTLTGCWDKARKVLLSSQE